MRRVVHVLVLVVVVLISAAVATAALGAQQLRVLGRASSAGDFAVAAASGSKQRPGGMWVRAYGRDLSVIAVIACSRGFSVGSRSQEIPSAVSGRLYRLRLPLTSADSCDVTASVSGSGSIRIQILG